LDIPSITHECVIDAGVDATGARLGAVELRQPLSQVS